MPPPRPALTHFLCLPLVTPASRANLARSLDDFRADITSASGFGLPEEAVRPLGTLHLTLGVMSLPQADDVQRAVDVLGGLKPREILAGIKPPVMPGVSTEPPQPVTAVAPPGSAAETQKPLTIKLRGMQTMQAASKASVLYAPPVDQDGTLHMFCERLRGPFKEAGLMVEENRPLLLHATIVNTIYVRGSRRGSGGGGGGGKGKGKGRGKMTFDARGVLDRYEDFVWAEDLRLETVAICRMGAKKSEGAADGSEAGGGGDAAYEVEAEVPI